MSTKTTFKRIALVTVAALGFGVLTSVAPASATENTSLLASLSVGTVPTPQVGVVNTTPVTVSYTGTAVGSDTFTVNVRVTSAPAGSQYRSLSSNLYTGVTASGNTIAAKLNIAKATGNIGVLTTPTAWTDSVTVGSLFTSAPSASTAKTATFNVSFTPDVAGTYTIKLVTTGGLNNTPITWTIVATDPVQKSATAFINTDLSADSTADASSLVFSSAASTTAKARLTVKQYSTTDTATATTAAISKDVVVSISKGLVSKTNDYAAGAASVTTAAATATSAAPSESA